MTSDLSYRALVREPGFPFLLLLCGGVWLFAADRLMEATLLPDIVADIGGAVLISWGRTLFEAASIMTGMIAAFLVRRWGVRTSFSVCAGGFVVGCLISYGAEDMLTFQAGRFFQALAGAAFVSLASISVARMFPLAMIARGGSIIAVVWGFAAFSGPLVGGLFAEFGTWRDAFIYLTIFGAVLTVLSATLLGRHPALASPIRIGRGENFPALRMAVLLVGVMSIASAAIEISWVLTPALVIGGLALLCLFLWLDGRSGDRRLLPLGATRPGTRVGAASLMVVTLSVAVIGISTFGPVLFVVLYDIPPIQIGFMMFTASLGWTLAEVVFSGTPAEREGRIIMLGALLVLAGVSLFNVAFLTDQIWLLAVGFMLDGAGFGAAWNLIARRQIADSEGLEKDRIAGSIHTMQRIGTALGAATLGILANAQGFSELMTAETARVISHWLVGLAVPVTLIGVWACRRFIDKRHDLQHPVPPQIADPVQAVA